MAKLIIVCGLPGSGKSTLAAELSKRLNVSCLHKDGIKENLFEILKLSTPEEGQRVGVQAIQLLLRLAEEQVANGVDLIIEAPFNFSEDYASFIQWSEKYGTDLYAIVCRIPPEVRRERFFNRPRHHSHFDTEASYDAYYNGQDREAAYASLPGKKLELITNRDVKTLIQEVIDFLK